MSQMQQGPNGILLISAASGGGKSATADELCKHYGYNKVITVTTRAPRPHEVDGVHYLFMDKEAFQHAVARGEFIEHANVYGNFYGTLHATIGMTLREGKPAVLVVDVQGREAFSKLPPEVKNRITSVYLDVPQDVLEARLLKRHAAELADSTTRTSTEEMIKKRLAEAESERGHIPLFDFRVVNDGRPDRTIAAVAADVVTGHHTFFNRQQQRVLPTPRWKLPPNHPRLRSPGTTFSIVPE